MSPIPLVTGARGDNIRDDDIYRLVETLHGRISPCEILNNCVIIKRWNIVEFMRISRHYMGVEQSVRY